MTETKKQTLFEFVRERIVPINAIITLSITFSVVLDFFAPKAPYLAWFSYGIAFLVLVCMIAEVLFPEKVTKFLDESRFILSGTLKFLWMGRRPAWHSPAWQALALITLIVLVLGQVSKANAATGGFIATNFPDISKAQVILLKLDQHLGEVHEELKTIKKETSADPRKELINLGVKFNEHEFEAAVAASDLRAIRLFIDAGIIIDERAPNIIVKAMLRSTPEISIEVGKVTHTLTLEQCDTALFLLMPEVNKPSSAQKALFSKACGSDQFKSFLLNKINQENQQIVKAEKELTAWKNRSLDETRAAEAKEKECWAKAAKSVSSIFHGANCDQDVKAPSLYISNSINGLKTIYSWL
jgi:hypothetical protein